MEASGLTGHAQMSSVKGSGSDGGDNGICMRGDYT